MSGTLLAIALTAFLFATDTASPFILYGFAFSVGAISLAEKQYSAAWPWLFCLLFFSFPQSHNTFAILGIMMLFPCISMCRIDMKPCFIVLFLYALWLIYQYFFLPDIMYHGKRAAHPLLNPNNAAQVINFGLVSSVCLFIKNPKILLGLVSVLFATALYTTSSKGGIIAAAIVIGIYAFTERPALRGVIVLLALACVAGLVFYSPAQDAFMQRVIIWEKSLSLIGDGKGIGSFYKLYQPIMGDDRTISAGFFAHNDILQILIEMGWVSVLIFIAVFGKIFMSGRGVAKYTLLTTVIHSLVSFPFYMAPVSLLAGLTLSKATYKEGQNYGRRKRGRF